MMIPDHPVIRNMERTGWPTGREPPQPLCPVCGGECDTVYTSDLDGSVVGCDLCLTGNNPYEREDCFPGKER